MKTLQPTHLFQVSAGSAPPMGTIDAQEMALLKADWERYQKTGRFKDSEKYYNDLRDALKD